MEVVTARFPPAESPASTMCSPVVPVARERGEGERGGGGGNIR